MKYDYNSVTGKIEMEVDEHFFEILSALDVSNSVKGIPSVIIANTIKGKGASFAENQAGFHNVALSKEQHDLALEDVNKKIAVLDID